MIHLQSLEIWTVIQMVVTLLLFPPSSSLQPAPPPLRSFPRPCPSHTNVYCVQTHPSPLFLYFLHSFKHLGASHSLLVYRYKLVHMFEIIPHLTNKKYFRQTLHFI